MSHHGVRIPLGLIGDRLRAAGSPPRVSIIDAAQLPGHLPPDRGVSAAGLVIAGCHKWPGAMLPLGLGVLTGLDPEQLARATGDLVAAARGEDPLLSFLQEQEGGSPVRMGETVNLTPLFTARAALAGCGDHDAGATAIRKRLRNGSLVANLTASTGWAAVCLHPSVRSGILLLRASSREHRGSPGAAIRERFLARGVVLTAYDGGYVRLSLPAVPLRGAEVDTLRRALRGVLLSRRSCKPAAGLT